MRLSKLDKSDYILRFGKPYILDLLDTDMMHICKEKFDAVQPNFFEDIVSKNIMKDEG